MLERKSHTSAEQYFQRRVSAISFNFIIPKIVLGALILDIAWEIFKENISLRMQRDWPWRINLLNLSTSATVAGILISIIVARAQFSRSISPALGLSSMVTEKSRVIKRSQLTVYLHNSGSGRAILRDVKYRYTMAAPAHGQASIDDPNRWLSWNETVHAIEKFGLGHYVDFFLLHLTSGAVIRPTIADSKGREFAAFNAKATAKLLRLEALLQVEDILGDVHQRIIRFVGTGIV